MLHAKLPLKKYINGGIAGCAPFWRHWNATSDLFPLEMALAEITHHDGITVLGAHRKTISFQTNTLEFFFLFF